MSDEQPPKFLLMRHAEADYSQPGKWNAPGWGAELAPLTEAGQAQVLSCIDKIKAYDPQIVLVSPYCRAMHTALIVREHIHAPFQVEFDLHEWVPHREFNWRTFAELLPLQEDYYANHGEYPPGEFRAWEPKSHMRARASGVLKRYAKFDRVLTICHGMLIESLTGQRDIQFVQLVPFNEELEAL